MDTKFWDIHLLNTKVLSITVLLTGLAGRDPATTFQPLIATSFHQIELICKNKLCSGIVQEEPNTKGQANVL